MALSPLEYLQTLMSGGGQLSDQTNPSVQLLAGGQSNAANNPNLKLAALRDARLSEMRHNLQVNPRGTVASQSDLTELEGDEANDPYTGVAQQARTAGINKANDAAILAGYGGTSKIDHGPGGWSASGGTQMPAQRQAEDTRARELAKSRIPLDVAGVQGNTSRDVANITSGAQRDIEGMKEKQQTQRDTALGRMLFEAPMQEGEVKTLPGGAKIERKQVPFPVGPAGVNLEKLIQKRMDMDKPPTTLGSEHLANFLNQGPTPEEKIAVERSLDAIHPQWRSRMGPGFQFAAPATAAPSQLTAPGAGGGAQRMTKPLRNGGVAYSDDGGKTWFQD